MSQSPPLVLVSQFQPGILVAEWAPHAIVSGAGLKDELAQRQALNSEPHALWVRLHGIQLITDDAWDIIAGDAFRNITSALAIELDKDSGFHEHGRIMIDMRFTYNDQVAYPVELFNNPDEARQWLIKQTRNP